jgi:hypothetical protein
MYEQLIFLLVTLERNKGDSTDLHLEWMIGTTGCWKSPWDVMFFFFCCMCSVSFYVNLAHGRFLIPSFRFIVFELRCNSTLFDHSIWKPRWININKYIVAEQTCRYQHFSLLTFEKWCRSTFIVIVIMFSTFLRFVSLVAVVPLFFTLWFIQNLQTNKTTRR